MKLEQFKIRASGCGKIMGARGLGKTGESFAQEWLKQQIYQRRKQINSKYLDKGNIMEDNSLDYVADNLGYGMLLKNDKHYSNDFITGTPDVVLSDHIIDVKNSWDCFTFPLFDKDVPNKDYYWQAQCYMDLVGLDHYKLIYVLMDTPEHLIDKEFQFNNKFELDYDEFCNDFKYDSIDSKYRIKVFEIEKNQFDVDKIYERVEEVRKYIKTIV